MELVAPFPACELLLRFVYVDTDGTVGSGDAYFSLGFAPGFDL